jgi:DNA-binding response OmpR family regulator
LPTIPGFIRNQPDVTILEINMILDINMAGGSGLAVLKPLKTSTKGKHVPVLVVSGNGGSEMRDPVQRVGTADLFEKPLDGGQLCAAVAALIA